LIQFNISAFSAALLVCEHCHEEKPIAGREEFAAPRILPSSSKATEAVNQATNNEQLRFFYDR
jgi:hypothetical protein